MAGTNFLRNQCIGLFCRNGAAKMAGLRAMLIAASFELSQYESLTCGVF
jgi:hypothetical protein